MKYSAVTAVWWAATRCFAASESWIQARDDTVELLDAAATTPSFRRRTNRRGRRLLCLGIFRDCDEDNKDDEAANITSTGSNSTNEEDSGNGSSLLGNIDLCLGIFRDCNETESDSEPDNGSSEGNGTAPTKAPTKAPTDSGSGGNNEEDNDSSSGNSDSPNCDESSRRGIFGGRPLFGECGIITEFVSDIFGNIFNGTDTNGDGDDFQFEFNGSDKGPFGLGLLPEGGLLWRVWNGDGDLPIIEAIMQAFHRDTQSLTSNFLEDWSESAVVTNDTCVEDAAAPECLDVLGQPGFWVCRTLTDPFTGIPNSKNVCIGKGAFLPSNDKCGCCSAAASSSPGNATATNATAVCPAPCPCQCDLVGDVDPGVWISAKAGGDTSPSNRCVDPRWAASITSRFERIQCLTECPSA
jgi:hypothetical protein